MAHRRTLVLNDARGMLARRGALAMEVQGSLHFPDYYARMVEDGLIGDIVWVRWIQEDPLWRGERDGAFMIWRFNELLGVSVGLNGVGDICTGAAVFLPGGCDIDACARFQSDRCFRLRNSRPLKPCDCGERISRELDLPGPARTR